MSAEIQVGCLVRYIAKEPPKNYVYPRRGDLAIAAPLFVFPRPCLSALYQLQARSLDKRLVFAVLLTLSRFPAIHAP